MCLVVHNNCYVVLPLYGEEEIEYAAQSGGNCFNEQLYAIDEPSEGQD